MRNTTTRRTTRRSTNGPFATAMRGQSPEAQLMQAKAARYYLAIREHLIVSGKFSRADFKKAEIDAAEEYLSDAAWLRSIARDVPLRTIGGGGGSQQRRRRVATALVERARQVE